ncbi:MAG: TetR/AcrR family transcriptional regulator [Spirochaetaceae bacterium]|nr:TetR/AcrR family transcriptional regulator [Spirochaetaceae bacterium]
MSKRDLILESASTLFINKGYKNLTMDEIADYVGLSKKTLYNHFPGKFELMKEAIELKLEKLLTELQKIASDNSEHFTIKLKRLIRFAAHSFSTEFPLTKLATENAIIQNIIFPAISKHIINITGTVLKEGVEKGILRNDMKDETPPYILMGIIETFITMESRYGIKKSTDDLFVFIEKVLLEGVLSDGGREEYRQLGDDL